MNIFGWKSTGRGLLRPAKTRVQQDRLSGIRGDGVPSLGDWPRNYEALMRWCLVMKCSCKIESKLLTALG